MFGTIFGALLEAAIVTAVVNPGVGWFQDQQRLAAGARHTCVIAGDGTVQCWGSNREGQLGDGTRTERARAMPVKGLNDAVEVVAGTDHTCARRKGGEVMCWGSAEDGEVGDGTKFVGSDQERFKRMRAGELPARTEPVQVVGLGPAEGLYAGRGLTCARVAGKPWCWGRMPGGKSRSGTAKPLAGVEAFDEIVMGWDYLCVRTGGEVQCLLPNRETWEVGTKLAKIEGITDAVAISGGRDHVCVLHREGRVSCMGNLMYAFEVDRRGGSWHDLTKIAELEDVAALMSKGHGDHTCAVRRAGEVRCWGMAHDGQLGHGLFQSWRRPVAVQGLQGPRALVGGHAHTCAITGAQEVVCWGENQGGQLGWEPAGIEVPELRKGRRGHDEIAMQLRDVVRASPAPVVALRLTP